MGQPIDYNIDNHPSRRVDDDGNGNKGQADKLLAWLGEKVLPGLAQTLIVFLASAFFLLIIDHFNLIK